MPPTPSAIGTSLNDRYVLVGPRPGGPHGEWDAIDTLLHRPVIVAWSAPSAERPDAAALADLGRDPTLAMPAPVSDGRRILDGGAHGDDSFLVLELRHEPVLAGGPGLDGDTVAGVGSALGTTALGTTALGTTGTGTLGTGTTAAFGAAPVMHDDPTLHDPTLYVPAVATGAPVTTESPVTEPGVHGDHTVDTDATTILAAPDPSAPGRGGPTGNTLTGSAPSAATGATAAPRRRRPLGALVLGLMGVAALVFVTALLIGSWRAQHELVPDQPTAGNAPATTTPAADAPTTTPTLPAVGPPTTRAAARVTTTVAPTTTTAPADSTTQAPPTTAPPTTAAPAPTTAPPVTTAPTTAAPPTTLPPTTAPPTTTAGPAAPMPTIADLPVG